MASQGNHKVFSVNSTDFEKEAIELFRFQADYNPVYRDYIRALGRNANSIKKIEDIPFLPIRFFKSHAVQTTAFEPQQVFESSGTTGMVNSRHLVKDINLYEQSFIKGFEHVYGPVTEWCIIGLLPSYLERGHSSLIYMVDRLIHLSKRPKSGFYLHDYAGLSSTLKELESGAQNTLLIGVTYALLDLAEQFPQPLRHTVIMETGGMKGRRVEMIRPEVHAQLKEAFEIPSIHSEYGMTELLSQAYSTGDGIFRTPDWMKVLVRDDEDPLLINHVGSGAINIIDLANIYSCAFLATDDVGRIYEDGSFEVLGRMDGSDLRGCSLLVVE